jgi:hypothetical protein
MIWSLVSNIHNKIARTRNSSHLPFFVEIFIIAAWAIWKLRNRKIFDGDQASLQLWTIKFKAQVPCHA